MIFLSGGSVFPIVIQIDGVTYIQAGRTKKDQLLERFHKSVLITKRSIETHFQQEFHNRIEIIITSNAQEFTELTGFNWRTGGIFQKGRGKLIFQNLNSLYGQGVIEPLLRHELCHAMFDQFRFKDIVLEEALCLAYAGLNYQLEPSGTLSNNLNQFKKKMQINLKNTGNRRRKAYAILSFWGAELLTRKPMLFWVKNGSAQLEQKSFQKLRKKLEWK